MTRMEKIDYVLSELENLANTIQGKIDSVRRNIIMRQASKKNIDTWMTEDLEFQTDELERVHKTIKRVQTIKNEEFNKLLNEVLEQK